MAKKNETVAVREYIRQEDIDRVLEEAFDEYAEAQAELELQASDLVDEAIDAFDFDDDDLGLISNEDIEALLKGGTHFDRAVPSRPSAASGAARFHPPEDEGSIINQSDIDALLSGVLESDEPAPPAPEKAPSPNIKPNIKEDKEEDKEEDSDGLISQSDIDALLNAEDSEQSAPAGEAAFEASGDEETVGDLISQADINALLNAEKDAQPAMGAGEGVVSQSDIDALLNAAASGQPDDAGSLSALTAFDEAFVPKEANEKGEVVSQEDIDALLMEALEAEDVSDVFAPGDEDAAITEKIAANAGLEGLPEEKSEAQPASQTVILAADENEGDARASDAVVRAPGKRWYHRRVYQVTAMAALVLIISSSVGVVMRRGGNEGPRPVVLSFPVPQAGAPLAAETVPVGTDIAMTGFLVLAPEGKGDFTCLAADLSLDFTDRTIVAVIKDHEAFIRNMIYELINNALLSIDMGKMNKVDLALSVREALGSVVPRESIRAVSFNKFEFM